MNYKQLGFVVAAAVELGTGGTFVGHRCDRDPAPVWSQLSSYAQIDGGDGAEVSETRKER